MTDNTIHPTASAVVIRREVRTILLVCHREMRLRVFPGGHVEAGERDFSATALREVNEETGVNAVLLSTTPLQTEVFDAPASGDQPAHQHEDYLYLMETEDSRITAQQQEVAGAFWYTLDELEGLAQLRGIEYPMRYDVLPAARKALDVYDGLTR